MRNRIWSRRDLLTKSIRYLQKNGFVSFIKRIRQEFQPARIHSSVATETAFAPQEKVNTDNLVDTRFLLSRPLRVYQSPGTSRRINLITDSINTGSLFGGVATAIILSALLAERWNAKLRVITRTEKAKESNFGTILKSNKVSYPKNVEFVYADVHDANITIDIGKNDYFLTTSWWTTRSTIQSVESGKIIYLLQEDERMFYPHGDDHLMCTSILQDPSIRFVINTELLFKHFVNEGFQNIKESAMWFEPSFNPNMLYFNKETVEERKKNFFFYARPNHPRNLYYLGLTVVSKAIDLGIIDVDEWNIHFVGCTHMNLAIDGKYSPVIIQNLGWKDYCALVRTMDLGLSLMYTPHPSYPPLDLAASGAVVVTNKYGVKQDLSHYSQNILCKECTPESLLQGLVDGISLVKDSEQRSRNYAENNLLQDWYESFYVVLNELSKD